MRARALRLAASLAMAGAIAAWAAPAPAATAGPSVRERLGQARADRVAVVLQLDRLRARLVEEQRAYDVLSVRVGRSAIAVIDAMRARQAAADQLAGARGRIARQVRGIYMAGPGSRLEAFLSARSLSDVGAIDEFVARALSLNESLLAEARLVQRELAERSARAESAQAALIRQQRRLTPLLNRLRAGYAQAEQLANRVGVQVHALRKQQHRLEGSVQRQVGWDTVVDGGAGIDQSALLALLGPTGGRGCDIPRGLRDTGKGFSGDASWYGWDFAGQPTADGAIFDPRLFTAANRWLPFGTFLRVHYGSKCAIVLVNDRGPYGNYDRVIDLSWAAAHYLGVGVAPVTADILVPR